MLYEHGENGVTKSCGNCMYWEGGKGLLEAGCPVLTSLVMIYPTPEDETIVYTPNTFCCKNHAFALDKES